MPFPSILRATIAALALASSTAYAAVPPKCLHMRYADSITGWMQGDDQRYNRDANGKPMVSAFTEASSLLQAQRWRDALPLLDQTARAVPPSTLGIHQQAVVSFAVVNQAGFLAHQIRACPTWMAPDQSVSARASAKWGDLPKMPSAMANVIQP